MNEEVQEQQVQEEVQADVVEQEQPSQQEAVEQPQESPPVKENFEGNKFEENIRSLRESKEQAEYERDQLARYVENIKQQLGGVQQQQPQNDIGISDDDYVEGRQLKNVTKSVKQLESEVQQWKQHSEEITAELKLNSEFSDFNDVVTADNVKALVKKHPELRSSVQGNAPLYSRGKATYKLIKKFMGEKTQQKVNKNNQKKVQNNIGKPVSSSAVKDPQNSPLTEAGLMANGYNEEVGAALEKEMYDAISRY